MKPPRTKTHRRLLPARRPVAMPPSMRPRMSRDQLQALSMVHHTNLDAIARGEGTEELLWDWSGSVLVYSRCAQLAGKRWCDEPRQAMAAALELCTAVILRWQRTGRVIFTGPELQAARDAGLAMDVIAAGIDHHTALQAASWADARLQALAKAARAGQPPTLAPGAATHP